MGFARSLLLKASRSQWLARQLRERRFFQRAVKRFMPGETLEAALDAAGQFAKAGLGKGLPEFGGQVTNSDGMAEGTGHFHWEVGKNKRLKQTEPGSVLIT